MKRNGVHRYTFGELIDKGILLVNDGYRAKLEELGGDGPIFLRAGHVTDTHIDFDGVDRFFIELAPKVQNKMSQPGDVVITTKGNSTGRVTYVNENLPRFVYSPHLSFWRSLQTDELVPGFLRYWSRGPEFQDQLAALACATDMARYLSLVDQRRLSITLPRPDEQRAIAHVLGTLDDKIELNRRMNETLETMAQALFKSWFIDMTENGLPEGWREAELNEIASVIDCLHSKKPERKTEGKPLLQLWNIRDDGLIDMADTYYIADEDYHRWISRMEAMPGDCVITNVGRVAATAQIPAWLRAALGRNMTGIRCRSSFPYPSFLIECLRSAAMKEEIAQRTDMGTILDALNVRNIPRLRFIKPTDRKASRFEEICRPLRAKMELDLHESCTLRSLRDTLLPKLLSGAIRPADGTCMRKDFADA